MFLQKKEWIIQSLMFKFFEVQSGPRSVVRIEVIFDIDAFSKLNVYAEKDRWTIK